MSEVMFDKKRGISGELPEHMEWVHNTAIPLFESWGHDVKILRSDKDYLDLFNHIVTRSKLPGRNGCKNGFPIGGRCWLNSRCKRKPINEFLRSLDGDFIQYVGIAVDEPKRLKRLNGTNKISLLNRYGYTEQMAFDLCKQYNLLSPIYQYAKRGGCWFCPSATICENAHVKQFYLELWSELERLSHTENLYSYSFKYGATFAEIDAKVGKFIENEQLKRAQITLFDEVTI